MAVSREAGETAPRPPTGSLPIKLTEWTGDHSEIKRSMGVDPDTKVMIDPAGNAWAENPDGTWTNYGAVANHTAAGKPKGRRGQDREGTRAKGREGRKRQR